MIYTTQSCRNEELFSKAKCGDWADICEAPDLCHIDKLPEISGCENICPHSANVAPIPVPTRSPRRNEVSIGDVAMSGSLSGSWYEKLSVLDMHVDDAMETTHEAPPDTVSIARGDDQMNLHPGTMAITDVAAAIAKHFRLSAGQQFVLRDTFDSCVVPTTLALSGAGEFTLEIAGGIINYPNFARPMADYVGQACASPSSPGALPALRFLQEPPHSSAVWLHAKLTKKGELAESCRQHAFSPAPKVAFTAGSTDILPPDSNAHDLLAEATVELVDVAGIVLPGMLHQGVSLIGQNPSTGEWSIEWPEMAVMDISRSLSAEHYPGNQKLTAAELQGQRGATGWFTLRVVVPGCEELWLTSRDRKTGQLQRAKMVIKNERNGKLGWVATGQGPYGEHDRCTPSHIGPDGCRLCCHGHGGVSIKMEA